MNRFPFSDDNKRYHTFNYYLRHRFAEKVFKVGLDAGFTCPNRDGKAGFGGCTFCNAIGSGDFGGSRMDPLDIQFEKGDAMMKKKWPNGKAIAYFQSFTNTYASLSEIKAKFDPIFNRDDVLALAVATRPDAIADDVLAYLDDLASRKEVWIELGLQSIHDSSAQAFNRGYDFTVFKESFNRIRKTKLKIAVHLLNGLPGETKEQMVESAQEVGKLFPDGIKIHMLNVLKGTALSKEYEENPFPLLTLDEYTDLIVDQLEVLPPSVVIQRLTGDGDPHELIAPTWTTNKTIVLNTIDKKMAFRNTMQGAKITE
ncbi:MAG: TIGR01212 family radical SAM protein [Erysipelotrichaceae bacterium]